MMSEANPHAPARDRAHDRSASTIEIITLTAHAKEQARSRLGWNDAALQRMAEKAFRHGVSHADTHGRLNRYLTKLFLSHGNSNNTRIYGEHVFLFHSTALITVLHLPHEMRAAARSSQSKIENRKSKMP